MILPSEAAREAVPYKNRCKRYFQINENFGEQYFKLYNTRLQTMYDWVKDNAIKNWGPDVKMVKLNDIMNVPSGTKICVIGVLLKSMKLQPSVLKEVNDDLELIPEPPKEKYIDDSDYLSLQDEHESVVLVNIEPHKFVTGIVMAVLGEEKDNGNKFVVEDYCFAAPAPQPSFPSIPRDMYVLFVSDLGFRIGDIEEYKLLDARDALLDFLGGYMDDQMRRTAGQIVRVIIAGNCLSEEAREDEKKFELEQTGDDREWNRRERAYTVEAMRKVDDYLCQVGEILPVDVVPGPNDTTTICVPQPPIHPALLPKSKAQSKGVSCTTNPYSASVNDVIITGTSGRVVKTILSLSNITEEINALHETLNWRHLIPTAPDSIPASPLVDGNDPLALDETPHIYFAGNQKYFNTKLIEEDGRKTRIVTIPSFQEKQECVLVNLRTLDCEIVAFN